MKKDVVNNLSKENVLNVCNFINSVLSFDINAFRPYEVKQLYEAKQILSRYAFKNFPHEDI